MKRILPLIFTLLFPMAALADGPYVQGLWTKGNPIYISQGVALMPTSLAYDRTFTNIAVLYHPLTAGSIIPTKFQPYLPPESWACTVGADYAPASAGGGGAGVGCGLNLLDSVRGFAAELLQESSNQALYNLGAQIAPGSGPANLFFSRQWDDTLTHPAKLAPRWFIGASFGF